MRHGSRVVLSLLVVGLALAGCRPAPAVAPSPPPQQPSGTKAPADVVPNPANDPELDPQFDRVNDQGQPVVPDTPTATPAPGESPLPGTGWSPGAEPTAPPNFTVTGTPTDRAFIDELVPTLLGGLALLDHVNANGTRPELKALATRLKPDWQARVKQLRAYRLAWFGSARVPASDPIDLSYLEPGPDYDWMAADDVMRVVQGGLDMADAAKKGTPRDETRAFATELTTQWPKERDQLNTWVEAWMAETTPAEPAPQ